MKKTKIVSMILAVALSAAGFLAAGCGGGEGGKNGNKVKIYVDAGGQSGNYNTSLITGFDTLETLAKDWNKKSEGFQIVINPYSMNGGRDSIVAGLEAGTAPDILFQIGTTIAEDIAHDWFVPITDYLAKPNPYVQGNVKWSDLYDSRELASTYAPDGKLYSVGIDKVVNGIVYNKKMLQAAGVTVDGTATGEVKVPETFSEFVIAQKKLYDKYYTTAGSFYPYLPYEERYDIVLESSVYAALLDQVDVLRPNGLCDAEEIVRAYKKGIYSLDDPMFKDGFLKAIKDKIYYKPTGYNMIPALESFANRKCAMVEVLGSAALELKDNSLVAGNPNIELAMMPYPVLDTGTYPRLGKADDSNAYGGNYVRRGSAGIGTPWWITNSASAKGQAAVDACIDFLMYVTAPDNNNKLVGDLGSAIPLNPSANTSIDPILSDVLALYKTDIEDDTKFSWHTFNSWGSMGKDYYDTYLNSRQTFIPNDTVGVTNVEAFAWMIGVMKGNNERSGISLAVKNLISRNNYDQTKW